jgi:hypothetical protein
VGISLLSLVLSIVSAWSEIKKYIYPGKTKIEAIKKLGIKNDDGLTLLSIWFDFENIGGRNRDLTNSKLLLRGAINTSNLRHSRHAPV